MYYGMLWVGNHFVRVNELAIERDNRKRHTMFGIFMALSTVLGEFAIMQKYATNMFHWLLLLLLLDR